MDRPVLELPDLDAVLALPEAERGTIMQTAVVQTFHDARGARSVAGRREWLLRWRAWLDVAELKDPGAEWAYALVHQALDLVEHLLPPADEP